MNEQADDNFFFFSFFCGHCSMRDKFKEIWFSKIHQPFIHLTHNQSSENFEKFERKEEKNSKSYE